MSVIRPRPPDDPLILEAVGADGRPWAPGPLAGTLEAIRSDIVANPLGIDLPRRLLEEYGSRRPASRMANILAEARRLRDRVDRLVIVADSRIAPVTRLLVAACCHPFHDQLPRGDRGGRPRLTWVDADSDNDRLHGIVDVVAPEGRPPSSDLLDQWAILGVDCGECQSPPLASVQFLAGVLAKAITRDGHSVSDRIVAIARSGSPLAVWAEELGCDNRFHGESEIDGAEGVFTAAALLPAAMSGINIVRLLEGAAAMLVRFAEAPGAINPVLADATTRWRASREEGRDASAFLGGGKALAELSTWNRHIRPAQVGAAAIVTDVAIAESRRDAVVPPRVLPAGSANHAITIQLPRLDEHAIGQLLQLMILSAAVERRLHEAV